MTETKLVCILFTCFATFQAETAKTAENDSKLNPAQNTTAKYEGVQIKYQLPSDGLVSLHFSDSSGTVVRELLHAAPRKKGANMEAWDGLDDAGQPVPAGQYTWKLLETQGLQAEYLFTLGINPKPDWEGWPGNHRAVTSLASDQQGLYVFNDGGEGGGMAVKLAWADEKRLWKIPHWYEVWCGMSSVGLLDGQIYMLQRNQKIYRADTEKGERNAGPWDVSMGDDVKVAAFACAYHVTDLDSGQGQIVLSYARHDKLRWIDPNDGKIIDEADVPEPYGVAIGEDGRVFVLSHDKVVSLSRKDKKLKEIIPKGQINAGFRLAVDAATGDILVAENRAVRAEARKMYWREPSVSIPLGQQVKRFSKDGKLRAAYGRVEGRRYGLYESQDFDNIVDIATTPAGGFVICESESPPRRTAVFDNNGKLRREWYGAQMYGNWCQPDISDPTNVWLFSTFGGILHAKVDYAKKSWSVRATYDIGPLKDLFNPSIPELKPLHYNGQTYLATACIWPVIFRVDEPNRQLVPLVFADPNIGNSWNHMPNLPEASKKFLAEMVGERREQSLIWTRPDGGIDKLRKEDVRLSKWWNWTGGWSVDENFNYFFESYQTEEVMNLYRLSPVDWTKEGTPVYDFDQRQPLACDLGRSESNHPRYPNHPCGPAGFMPDGCGNYFAAYNTDNKTKAFGQGFWANRTGYNKIAKWDKDGKLLWAVGRHAASQAPAPGEAKYISRITGTPYGCVVANDMDNGMQHVWDEDGLWVGRLLDNPVEGTAPLSAYRLHGGENFGGSIFTVTKDMHIEGLNTGDVIFFLSTNCNPVYRISGWDKFQRQSGKIELTQAVVTKVTASTKADPPIRIPRLDEIKVDGDLGEWSKLEPLIIRDGKNERAKVWAAWNPNGIFVAFDVNTTGPWKTAGTEQNAFQGGAEVDVCVGPAGDRTVPGAGDVRYVAAAMPAGNCIIEFMPVLSPKMTPQEKKPATYQTLNGKVDFDRVTALHGQPVSVRNKPDGQGYIVEMQLPFRAPLEMRPGLRLRFEAACAIADPDGAKTIARFPWHSRSGDDQMVHDNFLEAQLRPQNWSLAILGD